VSYAKGKKGRFIKILMKKGQFYTMWPQYKNLVIHEVFVVPVNKAKAGLILAKTLQ
jgi:L-2-hydroxyglutarate oxidase LhgO